jgi:hypothetical protein
LRCDRGLGHRARRDRNNARGRRECGGADSGRGKSQRAGRRGNGWGRRGRRAGRLRGLARLGDHGRLPAELGDTGLCLLQALVEDGRLLTQIGGLTSVREIQQHKDRKPDDRREPSICADGRDEVMDRQSERHRPHARPV